MNRKPELPQEDDADDRLRRDAVDVLFTSRVLWMLGNADRCSALMLIAESGGLTITQMRERIEISRPHMYQHTRRLEQGGWIRCVRRGPHKVYVCNGPEVLELVTALRQLADHLPRQLRFVTDNIRGRGLRRSPQAAEGAPRCA